MLEESVALIPSIWASINSWFTPTIFFVLLNLVIATIYITSTLSSAAAAHRPPILHPHHHLVGSPSTVLQRLKSINFYSHASQQPSTQFAPPPPPTSATDFNHTHFDLQQPDSNSNPNFPDPQDLPPSPIARSPSLLHSLKSINLYNYFPHEPTSSAAHPTQTQIETEAHYGGEGVPGGDDDEVHRPSAEEELGPSMDEIYSKLQESGRVSRTKSDTEPASGAMPGRLARKMRKSASVKSAFRHFEEEELVEARRPATVREAADEEVDSKADDFINKFKQQLKLQRIDSIIRYKEMVGRATEPRN